MLDVLQLEIGMALGQVTERGRMVERRLADIGADALLRAQHLMQHYSRPPFVPSASRGFPLLRAHHPAAERSRIASLARFMASVADGWCPPICPRIWGRSGLG